MNSWILILLGGLAAALAIAAVVAKRKRDERWDRFLEEAFDYLEKQQQRCREDFRIGQWDRYESDQGTGKVVFLKDDKPEVVADFLIAGTTSHRSGTWLWSWANPNLLPNVAEEMGAVALFGKERGFPKLFEPKWDADDEAGWAMTAAAAFVLEAKGAYRAPWSGGTAFMVFTDLGFATELSDDLFVEVEPEVQETLLEDWRWLVGEEAQVFKVTIFGDVFTRSADGHVHRLDTGRAAFTEVAESDGKWAEAARIHGSDWFHGKVLAQLRKLDVKPPEGQVYSWRQPPMVGGAEELDNVGFSFVRVHLSLTGRLAESLKDVPSGQPVKIDFDPLPADGTGTD